MNLNELEEIIRTTMGSRALRKVNIKEATRKCIRLYIKENHAVDAYKKRLSELKEEARLIFERGKVSVYVPYRVITQHVSIHLPEQEEWFTMSYVPMGMCGIFLSDPHIETESKVFHNNTSEPLFTKDKKGKVCISDKLCEEIPYMAPLKKPSKRYKEVSKIREMFVTGDINWYNSFASDAVVGESQLQEGELSVIKRLFQRYIVQRKKWEDIIANQNKTYGYNSPKYEQFLKEILIPAQLALSRMQDQLFANVWKHYTEDEANSFKKGFLHTGFVTGGDIGLVYDRHKKSIERDLLY